MKKYVKAYDIDNMLDTLDSVNYHEQERLEQIREDVYDAVEEVISMYIKHFGAKTKDGIPDWRILYEYNSTLDDLSDKVVDYIIDVCQLYDRNDL